MAKQENGTRLSIFAFASVASAAYRILLADIKAISRLAIHSRSIAL